MQFHVTPLNIVLSIIAALLGGAQNSVAGGGSFLLFPTLLVIGMPPVIANATNTAALWPGSIASVFGYREEVGLVWRTQKRLFALVIVSLIGGIIGAALLLGTSSDSFTKLIPFLLLFATLLFAYGNRLSAAVRASTQRLKLPGWAMTALLWAMQLITAIYGGYFGAGIGIVMLAVLAIWGMKNIHEMNGIKTLLATCINGVAVAYFVANGKVDFPSVLWMIGGAVVGGYFGALLGRLVNPVRMRQFITALAALLTVIFFAHVYFGI